MKSRDTYRGRMRTLLAGDCRGGVGSARSNWDAWLAAGEYRRYFPCGNESVSNPRSDSEKFLGTPAHSRVRMVAILKMFLSAVTTVSRPSDAMEFSYPAAISRNNWKRDWKLRNCLILFAIRSIYATCTILFLRSSKSSHSFFLSFSLYSILPDWRYSILPLRKVIARIIKELVGRRTRNVHFRDIKCHDNYLIVGLEWS